MAQIYIINLAKVKEYEEIATGVKPERMNVFIKKAQDLDLRPFLGYALFFDFLKQFNDDGTIKDDAPQQYKDLLNGVEYLDSKGNTMVYEGLIPALVYFTFARFVEADAYRYTATGPRIKETDQSSQITEKGITKLVQQQRSTANAHLNDVEKFLRDHPADFKLWNFDADNKSARQSGPRIRAVDRTDFNSPGAFYNNGLGGILNG